MELWEALSKRREEIGMRYADLERTSGLSISTIKKILGGHIAAPSYESVQAIAYAMNLTMADLDRIIANDAFESTQPTQAALRLARLYDSLNDSGKELINLVATFAEKKF